MEMIFTWAPESLLTTLMVMLKGMAGIFAVIILIWIFVAVLNRVSKPKEYGEK